MASKPPTTVRAARVSAEAALRECAQFVDKTTLDDATKPLVINVPEKQLQDDERLRHVWTHLQLLMQDKEFSKQAKAALQKVQAKRVAEISIRMLPVKDRHTDMQAVMPGMDLKRAIAIQSQLYQQYSSPEFQTRLFHIYNCHDPRTLTYNSKLSDLLRSVRGDILERFGFPPGPDGDVSLTLALSEFDSDPDVQTVTACIDELLYTAEAPMVKGSKNLTKKEVLTLLRSQIVAFRVEEFQRKVKYLKAAGAKSEDDDCYKLEGRGQLALSAQKRIFGKYGLEPSERGAHSLLQQFSQYIMDPQVATYAAAANILLGMEMSACDRFNERLVDISVEDPCPTGVKTEPAAKFEVIRRHSVADPEDVHRQLQSQYSNVGKVSGLVVPPTSRGRRRSLAEALASAGGAAPAAAGRPRRGSISGPVVGRGGFGRRSSI